MKTKTNKNIEAKKAYKKKHKEVQEMIKNLSSLIDNDSDSINWADVGSIAHVKQNLDEIIGFLEGRD